MQYTAYIDFKVFKVKISIKEQQWKAFFNTREPMSSFCCRMGPKVDQMSGLVGFRPQKSVKLESLNSIKYAQMYAMLSYSGTHFLLYL